MKKKTASKAKPAVKTGAESTAKPDSKKTGKK